MTTFTEDPWPATRRHSQLGRITKKTERSTEGKGRIVIGQSVSRNGSGHRDEITIEVGGQDLSPFKRDLDREGQQRTTRHS